MTYLLDTNICIYLIKVAVETHGRASLRERRDV